MGTLEEYQEMATECLELARVVSDGDGKTMLLEIAQQWMMLADYLRAQAEKA